MDTTTARRATCRYLRHNGNQCTGETVDPNGEIQLCLKHLGRALELVRASQARLRAHR